MTDNVPTRKTRRTFAAVTLLFSLALILGLTVLGSDSKLHLAAIDWAFWTVWVVFGTYIADANLTQLLENRKYRFQ